MAATPQEGTMKLRKPFKEVYIRLVDNEPVFVCTIQYGGVLQKSVQFALAGEADVPDDAEGELSLVLRTRRRFATGAQDEK
jgi:hypothetical protein